MGMSERRVSLQINKYFISVDIPLNFYNSLKLLNLFLSRKKLIKYFVKLFFSSFNHRCSFWKHFNAVKLVPTVKWAALIFSIRTRIWFNFRSIKKNKVFRFCKKKKKKKFPNEMHFNLPNVRPFRTLLSGSARWLRTTCESKQVPSPLYSSFCLNAPDRSLLTLTGVLKPYVMHNLTSYHNKSLSKPVKTCNFTFQTERCIMGSKALQGFM